MTKSIPIIALTATLGSAAACDSSGSDPLMTSVFAGLPTNPDYTILV